MREKLMKYLLSALVVSLVPVTYHSYVSYRHSEETRLALEKIAEHTCCDSPEQQISKLRRVLSKDPDCLEARWMLAEAYDSKCDYKQEEHHYRFAINSAPSNPECHYKLGEFYLMRRQRYAQAATALGKCLALESNHESAMQMLARCYEKMGNNKAALKTWGQILEQRPKDEIAKRAVQRLGHGIMD